MHTQMCSPSTRDLEISGPLILRSSRAPAIETRKLPLTCFGQGVESAAKGHNAHLMAGFGYIYLYISSNQLRECGGDLARSTGHGKIKPHFYGFGDFQWDILLFERLLMGFSRHLNPQLLLFLQQLQRHSPGNAARHRCIDDSGEGHVVQWQPADGEGIRLDDFWGYPHGLVKLQMEKHGFYMDGTRPAKLIKRDFHGIQLSKMVN